MNKSRTIQLAIDNALPHANAAESASTVALWHDIQQYFQNRAFSAVMPGTSASDTWFITMDASSLLALMEQVLRNADSFNAWRQQHARDANKKLAASLLVEVSGSTQCPEERDAYEVATLFLQQLVVAINLAQPGAIRLLQTTFTGAGGHRYEAQSFDSKLYYGAFRNLSDLHWWQRHKLSFDDVWQWLERTQGSHAYTAIESVDKVLFTALKVAEQRNELSSRTALLVIYQLEMLLDCRSPMDARHLRNRIRLILGELPEAADCITELYAVRDGLLLGSRPVQRPPLVAHDDVAEFMEHIDQHNNAVESGTALVLVLLRELISRNAQAYVFTESLTFRPFQPG